MNGLISTGELWQAHCCFWRQVGPDADSCAFQPDLSWSMQLQGHAVGLLCPV